MSRISATLMRLGIAAAALTATAAAGVQAKAQPGRYGQCLYVRNINGFNAPNDRTIYVREGVNEIWRVDLMVDCTGLSFRQSFGLESVNGDPWICEPIQAEVRFRDLGIHQRCPVSGLHKLTPEEVAALPRRLRP
ncbi:MAG TPA: DUF6491 family protein [Caulobacteraceae bacterium]|nr:DUF6491 family protein [Caulobacteraceae bacterium]